ncbi:MAG: hypothetical protein NT033_00125, partial [Candidatus Omnitrophica bacterium]|nr:hypothetical protein [Candidatus Omnitrophota bacterium]
MRRLAAAAKKVAPSLAAEKFREAWAEMKTAIGPQLKTCLRLSKLCAERPWTLDEAREYTSNMEEIAKLATIVCSDIKSRSPNGFWSMISGVLGWATGQHITGMGLYAQVMCDGAACPPNWREEIAACLRSFTLVDDYFSNMTEVLISAPSPGENVDVYIPGAIINQQPPEKYRWILIDDLDHAFMKPFNSAAVQPVESTQGRDDEGATYTKDVTVRSEDGLHVMPSKRISLIASYIQEKLHISAYIVSKWTGKVCELTNSYRLALLWINNNDVVEVSVKG